MGVNMNTNPHQILDLLGTVDTADDLLYCILSPILILIDQNHGLKSNLLGTDKRTELLAWFNRLRGTQLVSIAQYIDTLNVFPAI